MQSHKHPLESFENTLYGPRKPCEFCNGEFSQHSIPLPPLRSRSRLRPAEVAIDDVTFDNVPTGLCGASGCQVSAPVEAKSQGLCLQLPIKQVNIWK